VADFRFYGALVGTYGAETGISSLCGFVFAGLGRETRVAATGAIDCITLAVLETRLVVMPASPSSNYGDDIENFECAAGEWNKSRPVDLGLSDYCGAGFCAWRAR
jgi:hypothetical protein